LIRVGIIAQSPALMAGVRSLLAADPEISIVLEGEAWEEGLDRYSGADVIIDTREPLDLDPSDVAPGSLRPAILLLRNEPLDLQTWRGQVPALGVLPQDASASQLRAAVRALAAGLIVASPRQLSLANETRLGAGPLTDRETEVLTLLSKGFANKQIALALGISEHTVKFHVSSIYAKLGATNRTQAVHEGLRNGWIVL
jgi:DNA-binding CsgD family transcriptional regulator